MHGSDEALEVASLICAMCRLEEYEDCTIGVISMVGTEQALYIDSILRRRLTISEYQKRRLLCTSAGDYGLGPGSPCIDAGRTWSLPADEADLDADGDVAELTPHDRQGNPRVADDPGTVDSGCGPVVVDMGADEFQGVPGPNPMFLGDLDADGVVGIVDSLIVLATWGPDACLADLNGDGSTGRRFIFTGSSGRWPAKPWPTMRGAQGSSAPHT